MNNYTNSGRAINIGNGVRIREKVLSVANCTSASVNHGIPRPQHNDLLAAIYAPQRRYRYQDEFWIGANTAIVDRAVIQKGVVVGAIFLVTGQLNEYGIYGGNLLTNMGLRG